MWFTDFDRLRTQWLLFLLLIVLDAIFYRLNFMLQVQLQPGVMGTVTGNLTSVVDWTGLLLLGPLGIWPGLMVTGLDSIRRAMTAQSDTMRWVYAGNFTLNQSTGTVFGLLGFWIYQQLGGAFPPADLWSNLPPSLGGIFISVVAPFLLLTPILWLANIMPEMRGSAGRGFVSSILLTTLFSTLPAPFGLLGAVLHVQLGVGAFLFFFVGAGLAAGLTHRLSEAVIRATQRSRELAELEQLGRAIIDAPPALEALPALLTPALPAMFAGAAGVAWLWGENGGVEELFRHPAKPSLQQIDAAYEALRPVAPPPYAIFDESVSDEQRRGVAVPVGDNGEVGGLYVRLPDRNPEPFIFALQSLAAQIAAAETRVRTHVQALANERMTQELAVAGRIQSTFLPATVPQPAGWDLHALLEPARETSGDFYDFIPLDEKRLGLIVADVADKGTGAALYMALSRTLLRTYAMNHADDPAAVLSAANERVLADTQAEQFVTVFFGVLALETGRLTYANAGHNPVFLLRPEAETCALGQSGPPVGVLPGLTWRNETVIVPDGGLLALYTDGVTEAQDVAHAEYGEERLLDILNGHSSATAAEIAGAVSRDVAVFVDGAPQFDDITLVVIRRL